MIAVRQALETDIPAILALLAHVASEGRWIATEIPFDESARRKRYIAALKQGDSPFFVAHVDATFAGSLTTWREHEMISIAMTVAAEFRGRGVGHALMDAAIAWARTAPVRVLRLEVFPHNTAALALYERSGFVRTAYREAAYPRRSGERWDAIEMELRIARPMGSA